MFVDILKWIVLVIVAFVIVPFYVFLLSKAFYLGKIMALRQASYNIVTRKPEEKRHEQKEEERAK